MLSEDARLVIGFVRKSQGKYDQLDLTRKLRLHYVNNSQNDPGHLHARESVRETISSGKIVSRGSNLDVARYFTEDWKGD